MKWGLYIAFWVYALMVTALGFASMFNPVNSDSVTSGRIPTDVFTFVGLMMLYFAYASGPQHFHKEVREKKRFDLLMISLVSIMMLVVPVLFFALFNSNVIKTYEYYAHEAGYFQSLVLLSGVLIVLVLSLIYSVRIFSFNVTV